jgi:putative membrane protein
MKKEHWILLAINLAMILGFGAWFLVRLNYEFIIYVGVIVFFLCLIRISLRKVDYSLGALVGLTVWSALHLAGGAIPVGDGRLYDVILVRLSQTYPVFRYDQLVHAWGFGVATLVMYCLLRLALREPLESSVALPVVLVMAGLGVGALNEIVEFVVSALVPESGVGGYVNTSLDLCADLVGAILGLLYVKFRHLPRSGGRPGSHPRPQ